MIEKSMKFMESLFFQRLVWYNYVQRTHLGTLRAREMRKEKREMIL